MVYGGVWLRSKPPTSVIVALRQARGERAPRAKEKEAGCAPCACGRGVSFFNYVEAASDNYFVSGCPGIGTLF